MKTTAKDFNGNVIDMPGNTREEQTHELLSFLNKMIEAYKIYNKSQP